MANEKFYELLKILKKGKVKLHKHLLCILFTLQKNLLHFSKKSIYFSYSYFFMKTRNKMNFRTFEKLFDKKMPISTKQIKLVDPNFSLQQLYLREKKGRIQHISKNQRCFPDLLKIHGHQMCISNTLYEPSYISLESALRYYNLIPEGVFLTTAVSTKKTQNFSTPA